MPCRCGSTTHQRISHNDCPLNPRTLANDRNGPLTGRAPRTPPVPPLPPARVPRPPTREQLLGEGYDSTDSSAVGYHSSDSDSDDADGWDREMGIAQARHSVGSVIQRSERAMNNFSNTINQLLEVTEHQVHNAEMRSLQNERNIMATERATLQRLEQRIQRDADASLAAERFFWDNFDHYVRNRQPRAPPANIKEPLQNLMTDLDEHKEEIPEGLYLKWCDQLQNLYRTAS